MCGINILKWFHYIIIIYIEIAYNSFIIHVVISTARPGGAGRVGRVRTRPIFPPTSIFRKRDFIRFQAPLHRDVNLENYSTMIRLAALDAFPLRH